MTRSAIRERRAVPRSSSRPVSGVGSVLRGARHGPRKWLVLLFLLLGGPCLAAGLPPLALPDLEGNVHTLAEWQGKPLILNFWASWCAPCQYEIRDLVRYQEEFGARGLQVVGVGVDQERPLANVRRTLGINYPVLVADPERHPDLLPGWGDSSGIVPFTVVLAANGTVIYRHRGRFGPEEFEQYVKPLLK